MGFYTQAILDASQLMCSYPINFRTNRAIRVFQIKVASTKTSQSVMIMTSPALKLFLCPLTTSVMLVINLLRDMILAFFPSVALINI